MQEEQLARLGGAVELADFCPFSQEFSYQQGGQFQRSSLCRLSQNQPGVKEKEGLVELEAR